MERQSSSIESSRCLRGQVSVEFFLLFAMILVVFILFLFFLNEMQLFTNYIMASSGSASVAFTIAHSINVVSLGAGGMSSVVDIPTGYTITMQPKAIVATDSQNRSGSAMLLPSNVTISIPTNSSQVTISNLNGTITVIG